MQERRFVIVGCEQMSVFVAARRPDHSVVRDVVDHIGSHLDDDLRSRYRAAHAARMAG